MSLDPISEFLKMQRNVKYLSYFALWYRYISCNMIAKGSYIDRTSLIKDGGTLITQLKVYTKSDFVFSALETNLSWLCSQVNFTYISY